MAQHRYVTKVEMAKIVSLAKRRGFIFPSSEIYGGIGSTWDYGPLGVELKRNVKELWWRSMVQQRDDVVGLDAAILMHPRVWEASGHVEGFTDPLVECKSCHKRFRSDQMEDTSKCPECDGGLTAPRQFNLMFKTFMGPLEDSANQVWMRPETAQGIFVNFANVLTATRMKLPFGIAQIGKAFRNEITPGNYTFRTREFEQMEMEYFVKPGDDEAWHQHWVEQRHQWYQELGIRPEKLRLRVHDPAELAHYAKATSDIEYQFPWGWGELEGIANRTDFDLRRHAEYSGQELDYFDQESGERFVPYVIEPSGGVDRTALAFLVDAYDEEPDKNDVRVVLRFHPDVAPSKVAVLPLSRNEKLVPTAREVYALVRSQLASSYDDAQSIGRRYRRQDEVGTPLCVTVDFETVEQDQAVTIRQRDTMEQVRIPIAELVPALREQLRAMGSKLA
jgi:glycyl-tRNA synthetase